MGLIVILTLPYMAGYIFTSIAHNKETSQIETYLIGFFSVFLVNGAVFFVEYYKLGRGMQQVFSAFAVTEIVIAILFFITLIVRVILRLTMGRSKKDEKPKMHASDWGLVAVSVVISLCIVYRVYSLQEYLRDDFMLATVRTTLHTGRIYEYNPITSQPYNVGLINSKRIIMLPIYYSFLSSFYGIRDSMLLYLILTLQTILCVYFACVTVTMPVLRSRKKNLIFSIFLGTLILSGDYYSHAIGAKILWNGYSGEAIVAGVMLPYVLYVITCWYRQERGDSEEANAYLRIVNIAKLLIVALSSVFITGLTTGVVLIVIEIFIAGLCSYIRYRKEVV